MPGAPSNTFLRAFRASTATGNGLEVIASDADGFADALANDPDAVLRAIDAAANMAGGTASIPQTAFATAAVVRDGHVVASDQAFTALNLSKEALAQAVRGTGDSGHRLSSIIDDRSGRPVAIVVAKLERAGLWPLGFEVRRALTSGSATFGVMGVGPAARIDWTPLFSPWAFSKPESRLAGALVNRGDLREAAKEVGVAYETARETLATAMAKTGARRQPEFVRQLALLAFGELPVNDSGWKTLADAYDLTPRQAQLALLISLGATRAMAAEAMGLTDHTAKADLKVVYAQCAVGSGAALSRVIAEVEALSRLAAATDVELLTRGDIVTPLRFVRRRRAPGRIAVEDHGPHGAAPVVVFHAPINGRHLPRTLTEALQARGLRPISVERPGFGLTSSAEGDAVSEANADLVDVLDVLDLDKVCVLGRSVIMPMSFAAAHGDRVAGGVLLAATPPGQRPRDGLMATVANMALDHPGFASSFARLMVRLSSERAIMTLTERTVRSSPSDLAALSDPRNRADWIRACRQSSGGNGFGRELVIHADGGGIPVQALRTSWTVLFGSEDTLGVGVGDGIALWKDVAPDVKCYRVESGGRLLHLSHPASVAAAVADAWASSGR
jgi:pimeloyl-ACP methyl ester carboxylesterase/DNA-binding CsgD family transcriptional regulator